MTENADELALIRAIVAHPDDDTPRLIYADWLDEHDQGARARLIRVQCSIENLRVEEQALIRAHGREWGGDVYAAGADEWQFHRGFPEEVTMKAADFLGELAHLNDRTPLRRLHLYAGCNDDVLAQLAALPAARQFLLLELGHPTDPRNATFGGDGIRALATSPYLEGLTGLRLHALGIGADGAAAVADAPVFANLTDLALTDPALANHQTLARVMDSPYLSRLTSLQLGDRTHGERALRTMRPNGAGQSGHKR